MEFLDINGLSGKRIGVLRALVDHEDADEEINSLFTQALLDMESVGATIIEGIKIHRFSDLENEIKSCSSFRYDLKRYLQSLNTPPVLDGRIVRRERLPTSGGRRRKQLWLTLRSVSVEQRPRFGSIVSSSLCSRLSLVMAVHL